MLAIGQSASEPEPHRVRSKSLAIGADDLDARGRSPMCHQRTRPSLGGEAGGRSSGFILIRRDGEGKGLHATARFVIRGCGRATALAAPL